MTEGEKDHSSCGFAHCQAPSVLEIKDVCDITVWNPCGTYPQFSPYFFMPYFSKENCCDKCKN